MKDIMLLWKIPRGLRNGRYSIPTPFKYSSKCHPRHHSYPVKDPPPPRMFSGLPLRSCLLFCLSGCYLFALKYFFLSCWPLFTSPEHFPHMKVWTRTTQSWKSPPRTTLLFEDGRFHSNNCRFTCRCEKQYREISYVHLLPVLYFATEKCASIVTILILDCKSYSTVL